MFFNKKKQFLLKWQQVFMPNTQKLILSKSQLMGMSEALIDDNLRIINDCSEILQKTVNPDTFFGRLNLMLYRTQEMMILEPYVSFKSVKPSEAYNTALKEKQEIIFEFLKRYFNSVLDKISQLKSIKAKVNHLNKFYSSLEPFNDIMDKNNVYYYTNLYETYVNKYTMNTLQDLQNSDSLGEMAKILSENQLISMPRDNNHNTFGERLDKLDENGELPWGWHLANKDFIDQYDGKLYKLHRACHEKLTINEEIKRLKAFIDYYYLYKNKCLELGECFYKYFEDMHMKCHNSTNSCFDSVVPKEERLAYIYNNYDKLILLENKQKSMKNDIINAIRNCDGILQSELIKSYEPELQDEARSVLYQLKEEGFITREKSGRSFKLYINL